MQTEDRAEDDPDPAEGDPHGPRLAAALAFAQAGAWELDLATERSLWRLNIAPLFGVTAEDRPELSWVSERIHPDDRATFLDVMRSVRERWAAGYVGEVEFPDFRVRWPDDSVHWLQSRPAITDRGTLEGVLVDVTRQREAEEEARHRHERFNALVCASPDAILIFDRDGRLEFASDATVQMFGQEPGEVVGTPVHGLIERFVTEDPARPHAVATDLLSGDGETGYVRLWMRRPDGEPFHAEHHATPVVDAAGEPDGFVSVVRDITHHVRAQQELIEAREAAEVGERTKSEFLARTSHELRTPMNAVLGFAQLLEMDDTLSADARASAEHVLRAGRHLLVLLDDVLDLAGLDAGRFQLSREPVDVEAVVTECIDLIRGRADERRIRISETGGPSISVLADRLRLRQVLLNLLVNGVVYNQEEGTVDVSWRIVDGEVRLEVRDTGFGVVEEDLERLFEPFERLSAEERGIPGTGLGLALSRRLVEAMGGRIDVASTPGQGSAFAVTLRGAEAGSRPVAGEPGERRERRGQVVYVDDNAANLMLVRKGLDRLPSVRLLTATDAIGGLELVRRELPDLVLLDLHLPDARGDDVLTELRRTPSTAAIPVAVLSSDPDPRVEAELRAAGAEHYLTKPLDVAALLDLVERTVVAGEPGTPS